MDFVFNCALCQGPLVARTALRGLAVKCPHCARTIGIGSGQPVTDAVASSLLDAPLPAAPGEQTVLRRVRPAPRHTSSGASLRAPRVAHTSPAR